RGLTHTENKKQRETLSGCFLIRLFEGGEMPEVDRGTGIRSMPVPLSTSGEKTTGRDAFLLRQRLLNTLPRRLAAPQDVDRQRHHDNDEGQQKQFDKRARI